MKMKIFVLEIICLFLITCGIFGPEEIINVKGTITDATTGTPIDRACIQLMTTCACLGSDCYNPKLTFSDKDGRYSIYHNKPKGHTPPYYLQVHKMPGYDWAEITLSYSADVQIINIQLEPEPDYQ